MAISLCDLAFIRNLRNPLCPLDPAITRPRVYASVLTGPLIFRSFQGRGHRAFTRSQVFFYDML